MKKYIKSALCAVLIFLLITGCTNTLSDDSAGKKESKTNGHEPITIVTFGRNYEPFKRALKKVYPEINLEIISYKGRNSSRYTTTLLKTDNAPDIFTSFHLIDERLQKEKLLSLSGYSFVSKYDMSVLNLADVDGSIYLLPNGYTISGIFYNKTLFQKHNWEVPKSFRELQQLVPKIKEAGVTVSVSENQYPGSAFTYLFTLGATNFLSTQDGVGWKRDFLLGKADASGEFKQCAQYLQKWIDLGMLSYTEELHNDSKAEEYFAQGNTAFLMKISPFRVSQYDDGTGDQYGVLPWLSEDGSNNVALTNANRYFGLNKNLEKNPQKLEDALKIMEFLSTEEGQLAALENPKKDSIVLPLKEFNSSVNDIYKSLEKSVEEGKVIPLVYTGWENYLEPIGNAVIEQESGSSDADRLVEKINSIQKRTIAQGGEEVYACVEENLTLEETARLVGTAYAVKTNADCALISLGEYHGEKKENPFGVNGRLFKGIKINAEELCAINPSGWSDAIYTMKLTGKEIKQLSKTGYDLFSDGNPFPYVLVTKEGSRLDDDAAYTVVCNETTDAVAKQGKLKKAGVTGQQALIDYLKKIKRINLESIRWK